MEYNLEFDGTTVLCCVCGDKSSGFHYGVHSCEGCKGFFRRSIQQKIQYRPCTKNQSCSILRINRNRCQYCRLKKCIQVGMSRDAVRFGRVPKREKAKILAAMQNKNQLNQENKLTEQLMDEQAMLSTIFAAHSETCDFTHAKMAPVFLKAEQNPTFADYPSQMTCPLNPLSAPASPDSTQINDSFSPAIRGVVQFARKLPGFSSLPNEDQVTLLKAGVFEALLVRLAVLFRSSEKMYCLNGQILRRSDAVDNSQNGRFLFECMFEFGERVNALGLTDEDIALFSAVVLVSPDRPGLRNVELVQKIHQKLDQLLMSQMASNHPEEPNLYTELKKKIPDLRTLNTLHSEKLLAVKMDSSHNADAVVSTSGSGSGSSSSTPNYSYADYYSANSFKCNQSVASDWSDFGSPRSVGSSCDNESASTKVLDMCPYSPSEQMAQFHLSNQVNGQAANSNSSNQLTSSSSVSSPGSSSNSSAGQNRTSSSLSNFSSSSNHSYTGNLALHSSIVASACSVASSTNSNSNSNNHITSTAGTGERSSSVINKPRFGQLNCFFTNNMISQQANAADEDKLAGLMNRRIDSPTDSGIASGKEDNNSGASVCSSPRSDSEEHNNQASQAKNQKASSNIALSAANNSTVISNHGNGSIDDMPMLKRALQAPPLLNTTSLLMDEAYRHHKKFRATKMQQAQRELEAQSPQSSTHSTLSGHDGGEPAQQNHSLASSHSTLVKTLQQQPRFANEQHLKRTDLIHTIIMRGGGVGDSDANSVTKSFGLLDNSPHSTSNAAHGLSNQQSRSSIIHTATSSQSTLQQLLGATSKVGSSSLFGAFGGAPSPLKYNDLSTQHHISAGISPPSPASSLVNSPPTGLLSHHSSIFHYSPSNQHLFGATTIHPAHHPTHSTAILMEAQPLDLSNSKKSSAPITPPISPKVK